MQVVRRSLRIHAYICVQATPGQAVQVQYRTGTGSTCCNWWEQPMCFGWRSLGDCSWGGWRCFAQLCFSDPFTTSTNACSASLPSESCPCLNRLGLKAIYRYYWHHNDAIIGNTDWQSSTGAEFACAQCKPKPEVLMLHHCRPGKHAISLHVQEKTQWQQPNLKCSTPTLCVTHPWGINHIHFDLCAVMSTMDKLVLYTICCLGFASCTKCKLHTSTTSSLAQSGQSSCIMVITDCSNFGAVKQLLEMQNKLWCQRNVRFTVEV